jgi:hypothetical protein
MLDPEDREFLDMFMSMSEEEKTELTHNMSVYDLMYLAQMLMIRSEELLEERVAESDMAEAKEVCRHVFGFYPKT